MKRLLSLAFIWATTVTGFAQEKPLSEIDRELLLEKLEKIQENCDHTVNGRCSVALAAFRSARDNEAAAHALYLNCIEKLRFEDEAKKASAFRDWKKTHKERTDTPGFRLALRHQLNWLVLSLEAAESQETSKLAGKGIAVLEAILRDADKLKGQKRLLESPVMSSIFAKAYEVNTISADSWPTSPLAIESLYNDVILPPLRTPTTTAALRQSWLKRIEHEGLLLEKWTEEGDADKNRKPAFDKWLLQGRKDLMWSMEVDLFTSGDQKGSALRMLEHLKVNLAHKSAPNWIEQFTALVKGQSAEENPETTE